jgi:hypothetical protein
MRNTFVAAAVVLGALAPLPCAAAPAADDRIIVRTYDSAAVLDADRAAAIDVANAILNEAGVHVLWLPCGAIVPGTGNEPCLTPLAANEIAVRFVGPPAAPAPSSNGVALGFSLIDRKTRFGSLATIYVERVERLASACGMEVTTLLGRAVAHEIGHLLLGTTGHAPTGLMRAVWPREMLEGDRTSDFLFTPRDTRALHTAVDARNADRLARQIVWSTE